MQRANSGAARFITTRAATRPQRNRLQDLAAQYPLYSKADEANWLLGDSYSRMGARFRPQAGEAYASCSRISAESLAEEAKKRLTVMEMPIPEADPVLIIA